jgi:hypothetical protein
MRAVRVVSNHGHLLKSCLPREGKGEGETLEVGLLADVKIEYRALPVGLWDSDQRQ